MVGWWATHTSHLGLLIVSTLNVVYLEKMINAYRILLRKPLGKCDLEEPDEYGSITRRWMLTCVVRMGSGLKRFTVRSDRDLEFEVLNFRVLLPQFS
jgi:hypothetical protein